MICGSNRIINDINGPPKVEPNSRSAPGPTPAKNGMYSISTIRMMPPHMTKAVRSQVLKKPTAPFW